MHSKPKHPSNVTSRGVGGGGGGGGGGGRERGVSTAFFPNGKKYPIFGEKFP